MPSAASPPDRPSHPDRHPDRSSYPGAGLHPDRLLPVDPAVRAVARELLDVISDLPVVAVHGHVDPGMLVADEPFTDPASLLVTSDHYVLRVLHSVGVPLEEAGAGGGGHDPRRVWGVLCEHWGAFRGTATRLWLEHELVELFGVDLPLSASTADDAYDTIAACLGRPEYRPRALFGRFGIELLSTTDEVDADFGAHLAL